MTGADPDEFATFEVQGWNDKAPGYERLLGQITTRVVGPLLDAAAVGPGTRVLDVGCGTGTALAAAAQRGARPVGVDVSPAMVGLARAADPRLDVRVGSAERLPVEDAAFDAVVGNFLVHHLSGAGQAMTEFIRVLTSDGRLVLTAWDLPAEARFVGVLVDAITDSGAQPPPGVPPGPPFFQYSADDAFTALLDTGGFRHVRIRQIRFDHAVASAEELWQGLLCGTVRVAAVVEGQPEPVRRRIRELFDKQVRRYLRGGRLELPVSVKLAMGRKP